MRRPGLPAFFLVLLAACQPAAPDGEARRPGTSSVAEDEMAGKVSDSLQLSLEVPDRVPAGEPVPITFRVENVADRPVDLYLTGRPVAFDLIILDAQGQLVWRRLEDQVIAAILQIRTLGPGETLELEERWDQRSNTGQPVAPGDYTVRGELPTEEERLTTPGEPLRIESG